MRTIVALLPKTFHFLLFPHLANTLTNSSPFPTLTYPSHPNPLLLIIYPIILKKTAVNTLSNYVPQYTEIHSNSFGLSFIYIYEPRRTLIPKCNFIIKENCISKF
jgi:hypothetical protein